MSRQISSFSCCISRRAASVSPCKSRLSPIAHVPGRSAGIEFQGLAECSLGFRVAVDCLKYEAEVDVGVRLERIALDGLVC